METPRLSNTKIYTDGGCHGNPGPGAWAYRIVTDDGSVIASRSGYEANTTNNRMELSAVINGLRDLAARNGAITCTVVTDSQYVRQGITDWINRWKNNGWQTSAKKPVKNVDLWKALDAITQNVQPRWAWVKGHAGDEHNEVCDQMVQSEISSQNQA